MSMQMESIFTSATSSISHVYGNVAKAVETKVREMLPEGFIKDSTISTRVAYRHFQKHRNKNRMNGDLIRKEKPFLIIRPSFEMISPNDDLFLVGTHYTRTDETVIGPGNDLQEFLEDKSRGYGVAFKINRYRFSYEVELQLNTEYSGYDVYHYLRNSVRWEQPLYLYTPLESLIPSNILTTISRYIGLDISDEKNVSAFLRYIRTNAKYPITYMMKNASSNNEFFLYYTQNILTTFSDLNVTDGDKKGMITDTVSITFKINCDFNMIGTYYLYGKDKIKKNIQVCIHNLDSPLSHGSYVPIYTYNYFDYDKEYYLKGYTQYSNSIIKTDKSKDGKDDSFSFKAIFDDEDYQVCLDYMAHENPIQLLFDAKLIKERYDLDPELDWEIDWHNLTVTIHNTDMYATYRFIVYANLNLLNSRKLELHYEKNDQQTVDPKTNHGYLV